MMQKATVLASLFGLSQTVFAMDKEEERNVNQEGEVAGLDDEEDDMLTLESSGDKPEKFEINREHAKMSQLVANILEGDTKAKTFQVKQVEAPILKLVVEYIKHFGELKDKLKDSEDTKDLETATPQEIAKPIRSVEMDKITSKWEAEFINKQPKKVLFQLILGANYMDVKSLLHLGCAKVATMIKGKSPEEIKQILGEEEKKQEKKQEKKKNEKTKEEEADPSAENV